MIDKIHALVKVLGYGQHFCGRKWLIFSQGYINIDPYEMGGYHIYESQRKESHNLLMDGRPVSMIVTGEDIYAFKIILSKWKCYGDEKQEIIDYLINKMKQAV